MNKYYKYFLHDLKNTDLKTAVLSTKNIDPYKTEFEDRVVKSNRFLDKWENAHKDFLIDMIKNGMYWPVYIIKSSNKYVAIKGIHRLMVLKKFNIDLDILCVVLDNDIYKYDKRKDTYKPNLMFYRKTKTKDFYSLKVKKTDLKDIMPKAYKIDKFLYFYRINNLLQQLIALESFHKIMNDYIFDKRNLYMHKIINDKKLWREFNVE